MFQLWETLNDLESQLTSDEPKENVDASELMFARQRQSREAIIAASDRLQKDARMLMEQLQRVSEVRANYNGPGLS